LQVYSLLLMVGWLWSAIWLELYLSVGEELSVAVPSLLLTVSLATLLLALLACCCLTRQPRPAVYITVRTVTPGAKALPSCLRHGK
jgi:hypothetical protein